MLRRHRLIFSFLAASPAGCIALGASVICRAIQLRVRIVVIFTFTAGIAAAEPVTFSFEGTVTDVYSNPASTVFNNTFNATQSLRGTYTFDSLTMDADLGNPLRGFYGNALTDFSYSIGGYSGGLGSGQGDIYLNRTTFDIYDVSVYGSGLGPHIASLEPFYFNLRMENVTNPVFSTFELPLTPPDLDDFDFADWHISFIDRAAGTQPEPFGTVGGVLTSLKLISVPEPTTFAIFALALTALGVCTRG